MLQADQDKCKGYTTEVVNDFLNEQSNVTGQDIGLRVYRSGVLVENIHAGPHAPCNSYVQTDGHMYKKKKDYQESNERTEKCQNSQTQQA